MSRTKKGSKHIGSEPWNRRPFNKNGGVWGRYHKKRTAKVERSIDKEIIKDELEEK